jgi:glycosyltransferase involved in cell wall biosynthesis
VTNSASEQAGSGSRPVLSVVIPVFNRPLALRGMLAALLQQVRDVERDLGRPCEVIIADDGSPVDIESRVMGSLDDAVKAHVRWVRMQQNSGRSAARNAGAALAGGNRLLFLDCDSYPGAGMLVRHCGVDDDGVVLLGRRLEPGWPALTKMVAAEGREPDIEGFEDDFRVSHLGFDADIPMLPSSPAPWLTAYSHNMSVPRELFVRVGGFDEAMRQWGHEDIELGLRLFKAGGKFRYDRDAYCAHLPHNRDYRGDTTRAEDNLSYIKRKHPSLDTELLGKDTNPNIERKIGYYTAAIRAMREHAADRVTASDVLGEVEWLAERTALWIGHDLKAKQRDGDVIIDHGEGDGLLGLDTPFTDGQFDVMVNIDLWRIFPIWDLCLAIAEGLRVADAVVLVESLQPASDTPRWLNEPEYMVEVLSTNGVEVESIRGRPFNAVIIRSTEQ